MSSPKTPKTPQRRRLSLKEKIKIIEDSKKPGFEEEEILELCKSLEGSGLSDKINLNSSNVCTSCEENLTGSYQCSDCDETLCVKCFKAHSRLKLTRTHIVTPL